MPKRTKAPKPRTDSPPTPSSEASTNSTVRTSKWIRIDQPIPLPEWIKSTINKIDDAGFVVYLVGGSVRDFLLGLPVKDHDLVTNALPEEIEEIFPNAVDVGRAFGVMKVPTLEGPIIEIATFREDLEYRDHRHPSQIRFSGPLEDAQRRDFTLNAIFYDPKTQRLLDPTGGCTDLKAGVIRAVGDPSLRFKEDALRLLRAIRFACRFGFQIESETLRAIALRSKLITKVSWERIRDEMTGLFRGRQPDRAFQLLEETSLLPHLFPEISRKIPTRIFPETEYLEFQLKLLKGMSRFSFSQSATLTDLKRGWTSAEQDLLGWSVLLYPLVRSTGWSSGQPIAEMILRRLKLSHQEVQGVLLVLESQGRFSEVFKMRDSTLIRWTQDPYFKVALTLHRIESEVTDGNLSHYEFAHSIWQQHLISGLPGSSKILVGQDLISIGLQPGPAFSEILRVVEDLALEGRLKSKEQALEYVLQNFVK